MQIMKIAMPIRALILPLCSTGPVMILYSAGPIILTSVTTAVIAAIRAISAVVMQLRINDSRSLIVRDFCGSGR